MNAKCINWKSHQQCKRADAKNKTVCRRKSLLKEFYEKTDSVSPRCRDVILKSCRCLVVHLFIFYSFLCQTKTEQLSWLYSSLSYHFKYSKNQNPNQNISQHFSVEEHILVSQILRSFPRRIITTHLVFPHLPVCEYTERCFHFLHLEQSAEFEARAPPGTVWQMVWSEAAGLRGWSWKCTRHSVYFWAEGENGCKVSSAAAAELSPVFPPPFSSWPCTKAGVATRDVSMRRHSLTAEERLFIHGGSFDINLIVVFLVVTFTCLTLKLLCERCLLFEPSFLWVTSR